jgi:hypothetical protein
MRPFYGGLQVQPAPVLAGSSRVRARFGGLQVKTAPAAIRGPLAQGADNIFATQAIGDVLKSKIQCCILPGVIDG